MKVIQEEFMLAMKNNITQFVTEDWTLTAGEHNALKFKTAKEAQNMLDLCGEDADDEGKWYIYHNCTVIKKIVTVEAV